jgi:hypothetical protein
MLMLRQQQGTLTWQHLLVVAQEEVSLLLLLPLYLQPCSLAAGL